MKILHTNLSKKKYSATVFFYLEFGFIVLKSISGVNFEIVNNETIYSIQNNENKNVLDFGRLQKFLS